MEGEEVISGGSAETGFILVDGDAPAGATVDESDGGIERPSGLDNDDQDVDASATGGASPR